MRINGEDHNEAIGLNIREMLEKYDFPTVMVAVECNGEIVTKSQWEERILEAQDIVEVVRFVGGGD